MTSPDELGPDELGPDELGPDQSTGMLVVDDENGIGWWSTREAAVARVVVRLGNGVYGEVDAARPDRLLSWAVYPGADPGPLTAAVGDPELADLLTELRAGGPSVTTLGERSLTGVWPRRAHIAALDRGLLYPVHNGALLADEAVAELAIGNRPAAAMLFEHAEYALVGLAERAIDGDLPSVLVDRLRAALRDAAELAAAVAATELADDLPDVPAIADPELTARLAEWIDAEATSVGYGAVTLGGADEAEPDAELIDLGYLDILAVPPRIIAWNGADTPDLRTAHHPERDRFVVTAALAAGVDPTCREVEELLAWTLDSTTGAPLAMASVAERDGLLVAELPARGRELYDIEARITAADRAPMEPERSALLRVDRWMFESWNHYRAAVSVVAAVDPDAVEIGAAERARRERLSYARIAATAARDALLSRIAELGPAAEAAAMPRARLAAVEEYLAGLDGPPLAGTDDPTLVELVVPDLGDENDR